MSTQNDPIEIQKELFSSLISLEQAFDESLKIDNEKETLNESSVRSVLSDGSNMCCDIYDRDASCCRLRVRQIQNVDRPRSFEPERFSNGDLVEPSSLVVKFCNENPRMTSMSNGDAYAHALTVALLDEFLCFLVRENEVL